MSGETQLRRNLKIDIDRVKDRVGGGEEFITIILHDFNHVNDPDLTAQENQALWLKSQEPHIIKVPITPEKAEQAREWERQRK